MCVNVVQAENFSLITDEIKNYANITHCRYFSVDTNTFCIKGDGSVDNFCRSLQFIEESYCPKPALTILQLNGLKTITSSVLQKMFKALVEQQNSFWQEDEHYCAWFESSFNRFTFFDKKQHICLHWVENVNTIHKGLFSIPYIHVFSRWLSREKYVFIHSAGIGHQTGGILLPSKGGSGKTTTTLSCIGSGLKTIGDDFILLNYHTFEAFNLYSVAQFERNHAIIENRLKHCIAPYNSHTDEKYQVYMAEHLPDFLIKSFQVKAIVIPNFTGETNTMIQPADAGKILLGIAPSTMFALKTPMSYLSVLGNVSRQLPAYQINTGTKLSAISESLQQLLLTLP